MSVTFTTKPQYAAPGQDAFVSFALTGTGNFVKGFYTDAPIGSEVKTQLLNSGSARIPAFVGDSAKPWTFKPDVGGVYTFQIEQYTRGTSTYGGGYQDSPDGYLTETLIETSTTTIDVGQKVTQTIGYGANTATLTLFVVGDYIRPTTFEHHKFTSPIISDAKSPKATTAMLSSAVVAASTALANTTVVAALGSFSTQFKNLQLQFHSHAINTAYHFAADNTNSVANANSYDASTAEGAKAGVQRMLTGLDQHMRGDDGAGGGTNSVGYHGYRVDWLNALLGTTVGSDLDVFVAFADAWRAFEQHRLDDYVHTVPDTTDAATALAPLFDLHRLFLTQLATQSPTAPPSVNPGVTALIHSAGFEEA